MAEATQRKRVKPRAASELAALRRENKRLKKTLEYKQHNISLLNLINTNMRATLKARETYYIILTAVTAEPGLGLNRAMLFVKEKETGKIRGALAISPVDRRHMKTFYEEVAAKKFDFGFYIEQFYNQNFEINDPLTRIISGIEFDASTRNIVTSALSSGRVRVVARPDRRDFKGMAALFPRMKREFVVAPVVTKDDQIGVIVADNHFTARKISREALLSLQTLCEFAGSLILISRKYEEAAELSVVDELTGLFNFRYAERRIREEIVRAKRYEREFSLILLDIDFFKNFNDRNGHLTGNKALKDLAEIIRSSVRSVDVAARYGGEEFVVILPETGRNGARITGEKLLKHVRAHAFLGGDNQPGGALTVSGGLAVYPRDGGSYDELVKQADQLLYVAKANGKNQIRS